MSDFNSHDFFNSDGLITDPYPYYAEQRSQCLVRLDSEQNILAGVGYEAAGAISRDAVGFSNCGTVIGPMMPLPFEPAGDDINWQIKELGAKCLSVTSCPPSTRRTKSAVCSAT